MRAADVASREVAAEASPKRFSMMAIKTVVAGALGEGLEIYDFLVFSFFAVYISRAFFPQQGPTQSLLLTVATLGLGFVTRPLGAFYLGMYADRFGRKKVLTLTMWLMGGATAAIALLPSYDQIGVTAQICLVAARLVQGFASGGEVGSAALLMMEAAPFERRGIAMSWQVTSHSLSYIASGIVGSTLAWLLTREQMFEWGWRVPFGLGLLIVPAGIYIRRNIDETLDTRRAARSQGEVVMGLLNWRQLPIILLTVIFIGGVAVNQYLFTYMTTFALVTLKLPSSIAMLAPIFIGIFGALAGISGGLCADRFGLFAINVLPRILLIVLVFPALSIIVTAGTGWVFLTAISVLTVLHMACTALLNLVVAEAFPPTVRAMAVSTTYAVGLAIFGGSAQFVATSVVAYTGDPRSIASIFALATTMSLLMFLRIDRQTTVGIRSSSNLPGARSGWATAEAARSSELCHRGRKAHK
jgi:MFS family permease